MPAQHVRQSELSLYIFYLCESLDGDHVSMLQIDSVICTPVFCGAVHSELHEVFKSRTLLDLQTLALRYVRLLVCRGVLHLQGIVRAVFLRKTEKSANSVCIQ